MSDGVDKTNIYIYNRSMHIRMHRNGCIHIENVAGMRLKSFLIQFFLFVKPRTSDYKLYPLVFVWDVYSFSETILA